MIGGVGKMILVAAGPSMVMAMMNDDGPTNVKLVIIGDSGVGKTNMLHVYCWNHFIGDYIPCSSDDYSASTIRQGRPISMELRDTAGQEEYDAIRWYDFMFHFVYRFESSGPRFFLDLELLLIVVRLFYEGAHVFMLAFSIVDSESLLHIEQKWYPEKMQHNPDCPWILVGTKLDLRSEHEPIQDRAAFKVVLGNGKKTRDGPNKQNGASLQQTPFRYFLDRQYNDVVDLIASFLYTINSIFENRIKDIHKYMFDIGKATYKIFCC